MENLLLILSIVSLILSFHEEIGYLKYFKKSKPIKTPNKFALAVKNMELLHKEKYNCVIQHNGKWVYGWIETTGISYPEGMNTTASGGFSHIAGQDNIAHSE